MTEDKEVAASENGKENTQSESNDELSDLESSIIRQVEYYFGDVNLPRDKFLKEQINLDDGWVPLDIMIKFNRLAKLTLDTDVIANALSKSTSGLLEAQKLIEEKDSLKYNDTQLIILWQEEYVNKKQEEYLAMKENKQKKTQEKEDKLTREKIKEALTNLGADVAYIDFNSGDTQGWVRLSKENAAKELAEKITDGIIKIDDTDIKFKLIEGDEEKAYLEKTIDEMAKRRKNMKNFKQNKGKNFRGKGNRKRKHEGNDNTPPAKVKADN
ncbi:unnamed protein product [Leptidea sinapis]|uniref:Uncharacterized protein n=1 Tax=Leptidea sinapis TaxID=189913 RepID=A0A5E4Q7M8_9NEOP|nr:unnamed protein product [Leptidea sinapis]